MHMSTRSSHWFILCIKKLLPTNPHPVYLLLILWLSSNISFRPQMFFCLMSFWPKFNTHFLPFSCLLHASPISPNFILFLTWWKKLHGLSPRANSPTEQPPLVCEVMPTFADRGCHVISVTDPYGRILGFLDRSRATFLSSSSSVVLTRLSGPRSRPTTYFFLPGIEPVPPDL
jgi:hypothetical protein